MSNSLPTYVPRRCYVTVNNSAQPPNAGYPLDPAAQGAKKDEPKRQPTSVVTVNGQAPNQGRPVPASALSKKVKKEVKPREHVITTGGRPPNQGLPTYIPASKAAQTDGEKKVESRQHVITVEGRPPDQGLPTYIPPSKAAKKDEEKKVTASYVTVGGVPPAAGVPSHVIAGTARYPVYRPRRSASPPALQPVPTPLRGPANAQLGNAVFSNLPNGAVGFLHPVNGYCTLALFAEGADADDDQTSVSWPTAKYLVHPHTVINDLIGSIYGAEEEEAARAVGITEWVLVDCEYLEAIREFRLGVEGGEQRLYEVGWTAERDGENPVYLSWAVSE